MCAFTLIWNPLKMLWLKLLTMCYRPTDQPVGLNNFSKCDAYMVFISLNNKCDSNTAQRACSLDMLD